jgi:hypothetical protein
MKRLRYSQITDGEWFEPTKRGHRMRCCDCSLVHVMNFRVVNGRVQLQAFRHARATAASRRGKTIRAAAGR